MTNQPEPTGAPWELVSLDDVDVVPCDDGFFKGLPRTLWQAFRPISTAGSFAKSSTLRPAAALVALITVPLALAAGIIPFTHLFRFGASFAIEIDEGNRTLDLVQAMGIGLIANIVPLALLAASYVSLAGAFGTGRKEDGAKTTAHQAALRAVLYRSWLVPMIGVYGLPSMLLFWSLPAGDSGQASQLAEILAIGMMVVPFFFLIIGLNGAARHAAGCSRGAALIVTVVPFVLFLFSQLLLIGEPGSPGLLQPLLPEMPSAQPRDVDESPDEENEENENEDEDEDENEDPRFGVDFAANLDGLVFIAQPKG